MRVYLAGPPKKHPAYGWFSLPKKKGPECCGLCWGTRELTRNQRECRCLCRNCFKDEK